MSKDNALYWVWLARALGVASKSFVRLIERFEDPYEIYSLDSEEIEHVEGISRAKKDALSDKSLEASYGVLKFCRAERVDIITYADKRYPSRLRQLQDPPVVLFCKGRLPNLDSRLSVAVVGTRKMSEYGRQSAYKIAYEMAAANTVIVSGMALGVDAVAACGAIAAKGETVAVLGCGVDVVYPREHRTLYEKIIKNGAVISEFMPSERPDRHNFPIRNRIISGLCQGTLLVEGDSRSGALITARTALAQGREVFALPGKINESNSEAPNELIRSGAIPVLSSDDIIGHYDFLYHDAINYSALKRSKAHSELDEELIDALSVGSRATREAAKVPDTETKLHAVNTKKTVATEPKEEKSETVRVGEDTEALLASLDEVSRRIFSEMPIDTAVSPDALLIGGISASEAITALTMLELYGLVGSLPGGLYIRK